MSRMRRVLSGFSLLRKYQIQSGLPLKYAVKYVANSAPAVLKLFLYRSDDGNSLLCGGNI